MLNKIMVTKSLKNINLNEIKNKINFVEFRRYSKDVQKVKIKNIENEKYLLYFININKKGEKLQIIQKKVLSLC